MLPIHKTLILLLFITSGLSPQVRFSAGFPSGNLNTVSTADSVTYTVTTKQDIGGRWFYFRMTGVKNRFVRVRVTSSDVKRAVYSYDDVNYYRFTDLESPATNTFEKTYAGDTVYAAYYNPYTYAYLQGRLNEWLTRSNTELDTLGFTNHNYPIQELTITDFSVPASEKQNIWIHARTHPSETPSSFHFDGIVQELLKSNPVIDYYKKKLIFHCIPFTNPDGVYFGRSRTNYDGVDVEANWNLADSLTSKEVRVLKPRMQQINSEKVMSVFLNLHSQAAPYCTFWIHTAASTSAGFYRDEMQFCNLNVSDNPYFVPSDYSFSSLASKFPEGWLWGNHGEQVMALTYETPYDFYSSGALVTNENLYYLGSRTVYSIGEYLKLDHPERFIADNSEVITNWNSDTTGSSFYGSNYNWTYTNQNRGPVNYVTDEIKSGRYKISGMWPGSSANANNAKITVNWNGGSQTKLINQQLGAGLWMDVCEINVTAQSPINITVSDTGNGRIIADAFRVVYLGPASNTGEDLPNKAFTLFQNYPNPFNPLTTIRYTLAEPAKVELFIYNSLGELVKVAVNEFKSAGTHSLQFETNGLSSGVYYYRLIAGARAETKAMIILK